MIIGRKDKDNQTITSTEAYRLKEKLINDLLALTIERAARFDIPAEPGTLLPGGHIGWTYTIITFIVTLITAVLVYLNISEMLGLFNLYVCSPLLYMIISIYNIVMDVLSSLKMDYPNKCMDMWNLYKCELADQ